MLELLNLCGFEAHEIKSGLDRVEKAFSRFGITAEDIERGKQRLTTYYDMDLRGVRKILRLMVKHLVDLVLAREEGKKIVYGFMTTGEYNTIASALMSRSEEVYATFLFRPFHAVVGCIFDKMVPILKAAEKEWLKAGQVSHCANIKTLLGVFALDLIPRPDLIATAGFLCDASPKTIDLLHELYDMPTCCYDTCQDREVTEYAEATRRTAALAYKSVRIFSERVQEVVGFEITDGLLRQTLHARFNFGKTFNKLRNLIQSSDPLPISATHGTLLTHLNNLPLSINDLCEASDAINTLYEELQERVHKGLGVLEKGAPRILALLPSHEADPRFEHLVGEEGIAIATTDGDFYHYQLMAGASEGSYEMTLPVQTSTLADALQKRISFIIESCKTLNVDGVLDRFHVACRSPTSDALMIKEAIRKELGIPVLLLQWENFDPRVYDQEEYKRKFEIFKGMLRTS